MASAAGSATGGRAAVASAAAAETTTAAPAKYSVILPTYNERKNLPLIVTLLVDTFEKHSLDFEIVIVEDNSPDKTGEVADELARIYGAKRIVVLHRKGKLGLGSAYRDGLKQCTGNWVILMDADFSHHPKFIPQFIAKQAETGADIVTGTRYISGGGVHGWDLFRKLTSRVANFIAATLLSPATTDLTGSFRLYTRDAIERIMPEVKNAGYVFQMEIMVRAKQLQFQIAEVPITFVDRLYGESKLGGMEIVGYLRGLVGLFTELDLLPPLFFLATTTTITTTTMSMPMSRALPAAAMKALARSTSRTMPCGTPIKPVTRMLSTFSVPSAYTTAKKSSSDSSSSSTSSSSSASSSRSLPTPTLPTPIERAASRWVQSRHNPNVVTGSAAQPENHNLGFAFALLAHAQQSTPAGTNIVVDPFAAASQLVQQRRTSGKAAAAPAWLSSSSSSSSSSSEAYLNKLEKGDIKLDFTSSNSAFAAYAAPTATTSTFNGVFAPRFAIADTATPAWFVPSSRSSPSTLAPSTSPDRISANMMYKCGKLWYCETATTQAVDVPYLSPDYLFTVIMPRVTDEPTIDAHPSPVYQALPRVPHTAAQLIAQLTPEQFLHDAANRSLMTGLLVLPSFHAQYTLSSPLKHTATFSCSAQGLEVGGIRMPRFKGEQPPPTFVMSCHRPFVWLVRHRATNTVLLCGKVEQPEVRHVNVRYKQRRVQWVEDAAPVAQFPAEEEEQAAVAPL